KILAHKARESAEPEPFGDVPTRVVSGDLLESLQDGGTDPKRTLMGIGQFKPEPTPLPRPAPFSADLDAFPDEAFEEATKVASLDALARRTGDTDPPSSPVEPAESSPAATLIGAGALRTSDLTKDTTPPPSAPVVDLSARRSGSPTEPPARAPSAPASRSDAPTTRPLSPLAAPPPDRMPAVIVEPGIGAPRDAVSDLDGPAPASVPVSAAAGTVLASPAVPKFGDDDLDDDVPRVSSGAPWLAVAA